MKKGLSVLCSAFVLLIVFAGCGAAQPGAAQQPASTPPSTPLPPERAEELHALSVQVVEYLNSGDTGAVMAMMDETMTAAMDGKLEEIWEQLTASAGAFVETGAYAGVAVDGYEALEMTLVFENASVVQRTVFDSGEQISGLFYTNGEE